MDKQGSVCKYHYVTTACTKKGDKLSGKVKVERGMDNWIEACLGMVSQLCCPQMVHIKKESITCGMTKAR